MQNFLHIHKGFRSILEFLILEIWLFSPGLKVKTKGFLKVELFLFKGIRIEPRSQYKYSKYDPSWPYKEKKHKLL